MQLSLLRSRPILRGGVAAALLAGLTTLVLPTAAAYADQTISSAGPLTSIGISSDLNCSVNHTGDTAGEWYGGTACGTLLASGGTLYGPASIPAGGAASPLTGWTPVSQTAVTGSGTTTDPYQVVTVVTGGTTQVTETDTYVVGQESYQDAVHVTNTGPATSTGVLYRAGDCYLQNSDSGYGIYDSATGAITCTTSLTPGSRIEQMYPLTAGSDYYEGYYNSMWAAVGTQNPFPNTCDCSIDEDNSLGLSWNFSLASDASQTYSSIVTFSPVGAQPVTLAKTADSSTVAAGGTDGYTITASNPNATSVNLATLTDTLGAGFTYQPGTSTGGTTTDPTVSGQTLTWDNVAIPASGSVSLHFNVTAPSTPGTYDDDAEGTAAGYTVVGTGATAPVTVASTGPSPTTVSTSLSGGDESGTSLSVPAGTAVTDSATLSGTNASSAGGTVTYNVYTDTGCTTLAPGGGGTALNITTAGRLPGSAAVTLSTPGPYYWQASYSGDANNVTSKSTCGAETETVTPVAQPTTLSTSLSGGDESGTSISVPAGTAVTDSAALSGTNASSAGGTITYNVYTDTGCLTLAPGGGGTALNITTAGRLPGSAAVTLSAPGPYYWQASYSGDANNVTSKSTCGAETETVTSPNTTTTICQAGQSCTAAVTIPGSMSVSITGTSTTTGSLTVSLGTNNISCGDPFRHAPSMVTVSDQGLTINGIKKAVVTINKSVVFARGAPWWIPYAVCYSSPHPFRSLTGKTTTLGLLPICSTRFSTRPGFGGPPCVVSILPDRAGDVIESLQLPGYDPRLH